MIKGVRLLTSTGYKIAPGKWNDEKHQVKKGSYNATGMTWAEIGSVMSKIEDHFNQIEIDYMTNGREIDVDYLKKEFSKVFRHKDETTSDTKDETPEKMTFWNYYDKFTKERGIANQWTRATHQKFNALKSHLQDWKNNLTFEDFTEKGFTEFIIFLRDTLEMKNSTIGKQLGFLKWFLRWAALKGYNKNLTFQTFSPKLKTAKKLVVFLEWPELMKVLNYEIPEDGTVVKLSTFEGKEYEKRVMHRDGLSKARDIFCFCCFTSLRYSDASNLKKSDIVNNSITITTIKTGDTITIELNKFALSILEKYKDAELGIYALPKITNQRMNMYLKELCELCGLNQPITQIYYKGAQRIEETLPKFEMIGTHTGRRTFICNSIALGIPTEIIMKWTGHADYKSMKPYIEVMNSAKAEAMKLYDKL